MSFFKCNDRNLGELVASGLDWTHLPARAMDDLASRYSHPIVARIMRAVRERVAIFHIRGK